MFHDWIKKVHKYKHNSKIFTLSIVILSVWSIFLILFFFYMFIALDVQNDERKSILPSKDMDYSFISDKAPIRNFINGHTIETDIMNNETSPCDDMYEYSCGHYTYGKYEEVFRRILYDNHRRVQFIKSHIEIGSDIICVLNDDGCYTALQFYDMCRQAKNTDIDPKDLIETLTLQMDWVAGLYAKIRFLITNGITNYVHLSKEPEDTIYVHHLRPGGILYPHTTIHLDLYGKDGLRHSQSEKMTIGTFLTFVHPGWRVIFGPHARDEDVLILENRQYFIQLSKLLKRISYEDIQNRLKWFISTDLYYLHEQSCMEQVYILFPMTICSIYLHLHQFHDTSTLHTVSDHILQTFRTYGFDVSSTIRIGSCDTLLRSGTRTLEVENNATVPRDPSHIWDWIHSQLFTKWYSYYDPMYLYFTYPRILEENETPLLWYSQVNAFYDTFRDEVVIPPGILHYPIYHYTYNVTTIYAKAGFIIAHEYAHAIQRKKSTCFQFGQYSNEIFSDVVGFNMVVHALEELDPYDICDVFVIYSQLFCAVEPNRPYIVHPSERTRVQSPIDIGDYGFLDLFNICFECTKEVECAQWVHEN